jgi:hypothetical protein
MLRNMVSMIYNVWSWYDVKITQNYLLVLFLINIYSQDYNYTLKYSYGHYMVFKCLYQKSLGSVTSKIIF